MHPRYLQCSWVRFLLLFLTHIVFLCHYTDVMFCASSSTFLSSGPFLWVHSLSIFRMVPSILQGRQPWCLSHWCNLCSRVWFRETSSFVWGTHFLFFFHLYLFNGVRFQYSQVLVIFLFSKCRDSFWFGNSILSVISFSILHSIFSIPNSIPIFWLYILIVYIRVSCSFSYPFWTSCTFLHHLLSRLCDHIISLL